MRCIWSSELIEQNRTSTTVSAFPRRLHESGARATAPWTFTTAACARATRTANLIFDHVDYRDYWELIEEEVKPWSYMKFPYLSRSGPRAGLVPGRAAGPGAELRLHPHPARRARSGRSSSPSTAASPIHGHAGLPLGAHDRDAACGRERSRTCCTTTTSGQRADGARGDASGTRCRRDRGAARHPDPPLPRGRKRPGDLRQPDRFHHAQQPGDERGGAPGGAPVPRRAANSPRACSTTSRWRSAPSIPACRAPPMHWARCRWRWNWWMLKVCWSAGLRSRAMACLRDQHDHPLSCPDRRQ